MKRLLLVFTMFVMTVGFVLAQSTITGKVTDTRGEALIGASVSVKGTTLGSLTDVDGMYELTMPSGSSVLIYSYTGYTTIERSVSPNERSINISLEEGVLLQTAVVTALGISREQKTLGYGTAVVDAATIAQTRNTSALDALNGRVPGLSIATASGAPGASTVVNIRGLNSVTGNNQPLFVVDGIPMNNRGNTSSTNANNANDDFNRSMDFGNQMNDINPNEIESISVLKGSAASALYGARASNGVIMITTKKGKAGRARVDVSSSIAAIQIARTPHLQNTYGQGWNGHFAFEENGSWGPKADGVDRLWGNVVDNSQQLKPFTIQENNLRDFFDRGYEWNNAFAISGGKDNTTFRLSYAYSDADGVVPTNADSYKRHTFGLNGASKVGKLTVSSGINYVKKDQKVVATGQGDDAGAGKVLWQEIIQIPRDHSIVDSKKYADPNDPQGKFYTLDNFNTPYAQNPWWNLYNTGNQYDEDRVYGNLNLGYDLLNNLSLNWRVGGDYANARQSDWGNVGIITPGSPNSSANNVFGAYSEISRKNQQISSDVYLNYKSKLGSNLDLSAVVGTGTNARKGGLFFAGVTNLDLPGFYNIKNSSVTPNTFTVNSTYRIVGVYGSATLGLMNWAYLTLGARNDWSSTLPTDNNSFFYPNASLALVFSDKFAMPDAISFLKLRAGFAQTGGDTDPYQILPVYVAGSARAGNFGNINFPFGGVNAYEVANNPGNPFLKPEITKEIEAGIEAKFFKNRISLDLNLYNRATENQIVNLLIEPASGSTNQTVNLGKVRNKGVEVLLDIIPVQTRDFEWGLTWNFSKINNNVEELGFNDETSILLNSSYSIEMRAEVGKPLGAIYSNDYARDPNGNIIVNPANGLPLLSPDKTYRGSINPDFTMGFGTRLTWKGVTLAANADYRKGGVFYSYTARLNYFVGNAWKSQYNDREPWIVPGSVVDNGDGTFSENTSAISRSDVFTYWGSTPAAEFNHVLDRTFFKLRNLSLTFAIPSKFTDKLGVGSSSFGVFGRNLLLWTPKDNHFVDPESNTFGTNLRSLYGEFASGPATAVYGAQLNLSF